MTTLSRCVIGTLAYSEGVSYPLSAVEVWRGLLVHPHTETDISLAAVAQELADLTAAGVVHEDGGLFSLPGSPMSRPERACRYRLAERKFRRARRVAKVLRLLPFVRAVAVCNSLAVSNAREDSDVDLFLIAAPRRLWTARLLAVGLLRLLRLRPGEAARDPVCLHFFVSEDALSLHDVALPLSRTGSPDLYLAWWMTELVPLVDGGTMDRFWKANAWAREYFPNAAPKVPSPRRSVFFPSLFSGFLERLVPRGVEVYAERLQRKLLSPELSARANRGTEIVLSADRIKCHAEDRREHYRSRWEERVSSLFSSARAT